MIEIDVEYPSINNTPIRLLKTGQVAIITGWDTSDYIGCIIIVGHSVVTILNPPRICVAEIKRCEFEDNEDSVYYARVLSSGTKVTLTIR